MNAVKVDSILLKNINVTSLAFSDQVKDQYQTLIKYIKNIFASISNTQFLSIVFVI